MTRAWVALLHPLIVVVGALGICVARLRAAPGAALVGFVFFLLWAGTEAVQQSLTLVTLNWTWRGAYLDAADAARRDELGGYLGAFEGVSDGLSFLILSAFVVANLSYVVAVWRGEGLQRVVAIGFALAAGLGVLSGLTSLGPGAVPEAAMAVLYPLIQPPARLPTGVWLWRQSTAG